jgi:hypothetical protein
LKAVGDRTEDPQANSLRLGVSDEVKRLIHEFQIETWICG